MYEIKKIIPASLAKYCSIITAFLVLILNLISLILGFTGLGLSLNISWDQQLINLLISVIFFYIFFWVMGYLFALIYNFIASRTKGIVIEFKMVNHLDSSEDEK